MRLKEGKTFRAGLSLNVLLLDGNNRTNTLAGVSAIFQLLFSQ